MVKLTGTFNRFSRKKILVAGDLMLDSYTIGKVRRISPEAPVPVVLVEREEHRLGGAGNVLLNLISLGCDLVVLGRIGNDRAGSRLVEAFETEGIDQSGLILQSGYATPIKNRVIADNQQIVRIDHEKITPLPLSIEEECLHLLPSLLEGVAIIAISDYGKGFLSRNILREIIAAGRKRNIPIVVDPKGTDFERYAQASVLKPNLGEAYAAANLTRESSLDDVATHIFKRSQIENLLVTRSEEGMSLFSKGGRHDFPVHARQVKDVTGAGDTVLAMLTYAMANEFTLPEAIQLSNIAAGIAIEQVGCARVSLSDLARRLLEQNVANKIFDSDHFYALKHALQGRKFVLLQLSDDKALSPKLFHILREFDRRTDWDLLLYFKEKEPNEEFIHLLASLREVDFILIQGDDLQSFCRTFSPDEMYQFCEEELIAMERSGQSMMAASLS